MITAKIDDTTFDQLKAKLLSVEGVHLEGNSGTVQAQGATVVWKREAGVLTLTCTHARFGLKGLVEDRLKQALVSAGIVPVGQN